MSWVLPSPGHQGSQMSLLGPSTKEWGTLSVPPVTHCAIQFVSHHPGMLNQAEPGAEPRRYLLCPAATAAAFVSPENSWVPSSSCQPPSLAATAPLFHPLCPRWADLCHHVRVQSPFCSAGATADVQSPTLCCCVLFPSRDSNYLFGNVVKHFPQFSYFIIVAVTLWPLYSEPVILQNGEKTFCSSYETWFPWRCTLFLGFHSCFQCPELCTDVCYSPFLSINHCI